jgi:hypothetical protein
MHRMNRACRIALSLLLGLTLFTASVRPGLAEPFKSKFQRRVVGDIPSSSSSTPGTQTASATGTKTATPGSLTNDPRHINIVSPSSHELDPQLQALLEDLRQAGMDTTALERFLNSQLKQIDTLEQPQALPEGWDGWLVAIGAKAPPTNDPAALAKWRAGLKEKTIDFWKKQLASGDHDLMMGNIKRWGGALGKFDQADQDAAQAAIDSIKAHQELTQDVAGAVPLLGEAIDVLAIIQGQDLAGNKTSALTTVLTAASFLGPLALEKYLKKGGKQGQEAAENLAKFAEDAAKLDPAGKQKLAKKLGLGSVEKLDELMASAKNGFCFLEGTLVSTSTGFKPIEQIQVGDRVLSRDYNTGEQGFCPVVRLFPGRTQLVCRVTIVRQTLAQPKQLGRTESHRVGSTSAASDSDGDAEPPSPADLQVIRCTPGHEFYQLNGDFWTPAAQLQPGDRLRGTDGTELQVAHVAVSAEQAATWNFEVEGWHTYFVADRADSPAVWVHNTCQAPPLGTVAAASGASDALKTAEKFGIPDNGPEAFRKWFDAQSPADLAKLYQNTDARDLIKSRLRHGGGDHEWLMVSRAAQVKSWGMNYDDIIKHVTPTKTTMFRDPVTGALKPHGNNSISSLAHKELGDLIDSSNSFEQFKRKLNNWAEYSGYLPNGRADLPAGLQ